LVEARLFYTVAIHIFCSCGHTVKQGKVNRRRRCRKMCLHSCILFFWPCIFVDRIYYCFLFWSNGPIFAQVNEPNAYYIVTNSKHQHVLYADLIHLLFALFTCTMFVQKPSRAAAICLGYFVPSACPCFGQISLLVRHGGLCTTDCLGLMALGVITWWSRVLDIVILFRLWH